MAEAQDRFRVDVDTATFNFPYTERGRRLPDRLRTDHLADVPCPILFVQGERDTFGTPDELEPFVAPLPRATLQPVKGARHRLVQGKQEVVVDHSSDLGNRARAVGAQSIGRFHQHGDRDMAG